MESSKKGKRRYEARENIAHKVAKETLYGWIVNDKWPFIEYKVRQDESGYQVWMEFPVTDGVADDVDTVWYDEFDHLFDTSVRPPIDRKRTGYFPKEAWPHQDVIAVADIAVLEHGWVRYAIEITNKHPIDDAKLDLYKHHSISVIEVPANSILQQFKVPTMLHGCRYDGLTEKQLKELKWW